MLRKRLQSFWGDLVPHPTIPSIEGTKHVLDVDGVTGASAPHIGVTFVDAYAQISLLRLVIVPGYGGDTVCANTATSYESLSAQLRDLAENGWPPNSNRSDYGASSPFVAAK
jgi:alpha-ketoglutarate-dependent sulfate ester dioxygenase